MTSIASEPLEPRAGAALEGCPWRMRSTSFFIDDRLTAQLRCFPSSVYAIVITLHFGSAPTPGKPR